MSADVFDRDWAAEPLSSSRPQRWRWSASSTAGRFLWAVLWRFALVNVLWLSPGTTYGMDILVIGTAWVIPHAVWVLWRVGRIRQTSSRRSGI